MIRAKKGGVSDERTQLERFWCVDGPCGCVGRLRGGEYGRVVVGRQCGECAYGCHGDVYRDGHGADSAGLEVYRLGENNVAVFLAESRLLPGVLVLFPG